MKKVLGILLVLAFIFGAKELILAQEKDNGLEDLNQRIEENVKQWKETMNDRHFTFKTKTINRIDNKFISNPTL